MVIRRTPSDFAVREVLSPSLSPRGISETPNPPPTHPFALFELTKESLTTPEAIALFARALSEQGLPTRAGSVAYAGLKDKHALTTQHVTVRVPSQTLSSVPAAQGEHQPSSFAQPAVPAHVSNRGVRASLVGWCTRDIAAADIAHNHFTIVLRDATREDHARLTRHAQQLQVCSATTNTNARTYTAATSPDTSNSLLFTNYFGEQRFAGVRAGDFIGAALIRGDFEHALRLAIAFPARKDSGTRKEVVRAIAQQWGSWQSLAKTLPRHAYAKPVEALASGASFRNAYAMLPQLDQVMHVEAFQSLLWNMIAADLIRSAASRSNEQEHQTGEPGATTATFTCEDGPTPLVFAPASCIPSELATLSLPMLAPTTQLEAPWAHAARAALAKLGIESPASLVVPGLRRPAFGEAPRPLMARASAFTMSDPEHDELSTKKDRRKLTLAFTLPRGAYATVLLRALGQ